MICDYPKSLPEFQKMFPDEDACATWLFEAHWPDGFECPVCSHKECFTFKTRKWLYQCKNCRRQTSIRAGTLMQDSKLPLTTWFWAAFLVATQFQRHLGRSIAGANGIGLISHRLASAWKITRRHG